MIETEGPVLILIEEPYEHQNRPSGINKNQRIFTAGKGKNRAAIIIINMKTDAIHFYKVIRLR